MNALQVNDWVKQHWKLLIISIVSVLVLGLTIFQIVYPSNRLLPGESVDGVNLGGQKVSEAAKALDDAYGRLKLKIYFGDNEAAFQEPTMSEVGIGVDNEARLAKLNYPFWLRIVPGSIFWASGLSSTGDIAYEYDKTKISAYTQSKVGEDCNIPPRNATLRLIESQLQLVPSIVGGQCDINELQQALAEVKPDPKAENNVRVSIDETPAPVGDSMARDLAAKLNARMAVPMPMTVDKDTEKIPGRVVLSWLDFTAVVPEKAIDSRANQSASLQFAVNHKRMQDYLDTGIASKVVKKPGVSKVTTYDFKETARVNGANGRGLDLPKAVQSVENYINTKSDKATAVTVVVGPTTVYTRDYSPTSEGFRALLTHFAQDNPGNYSLAFSEVAGIRNPRSASYRGDAKMPAAGIHSLYLAYATVMEEYSGNLRPVDIISDDMTTPECFKEMIQQFNESCRKGFYDRFGYAKLTSYANSLGLTNTVFKGENTETSANDLQKLIFGLQKGTARTEGGQKISTAMRTVFERDGIPKGAGKDQTSHVTGSTEKVFNDAGVVFTTDHGSYVLVVLSNGEGVSWEKIAELTGKIQALKTKKIPEGAR